MYLFQEASQLVLTRAEKSHLNIYIRAVDPLLSLNYPVSPPLLLTGNEYHKYACVSVHPFRRRGDENCVSKPCVSSTIGALIVRLNIHERL